MLKKQLFRLALLILLVSVACNFPIQTSIPETPWAISQLLITAGANSTATPTPFQPVGPTSTANPTETPQPTPTHNPMDDLVEEIGIPTPVRITQPIPEGMVNFLVLGSDYRPSSGFRTDVIMLVSVNTKNATVSVVSFPRDLYVYIPGWMTQRINTAHPRGGFGMMQDTFEYNFGVRPTYYVMTNFQGFVGIVNSLGGIEVNVGKGLTDTCDLPWRSRGYCSVGAGVRTMDGATALWYVRSRHSSSDFDRTRRAQEVMFGLFKRTMSLNVITRLPDLYNSYRNSVETNMNVEDIAPLLPVASQVLSDSNRIRQFAIGPAQVTPYTTESGAAVLLPNYEAIMAVIQEAIFGK
jgi:polyisoprenyl-teichoic acid--peptidoglycan teichoic acid transferase